MAGLNPAQREAVRHLGAPLLVLAGAGTGKTRVITHKIAYLIRAGGLAPRQVAAVTFTNKAAREMARRARALLGGAARGLRVGTFHALGLEILREAPEALGRRRGFSLLDEQDAAALARELLRGRVGEAAGEEQAQALLERVSRWKGALVGPEEARAQDPWAGAFYQAYQRALAAYNAFDLDDLIAESVRLLETDPRARARWQGRIRHLLVDEYQDTNPAQYRLARILAGPTEALTVVGDDDQAIYGWRGADPGNLRQLAEDFPRLKVVRLEQNYRCAGSILRVANGLIARNPHLFPKRLWSELGYGEPVRVLEARDAEQEAQRVVSELLAHRFRTGAPWGAYAILYRGNHQARPLERALREREVPYRLSGGASFFDRSEVKDVLAYLRLLVNPDDDTAFLRVVNTPRRELGAATVEALGRYAQERGVGLLTACLELGLEARVGRRAASRLRRFAEWLTGLGREPEDPVALARRLLEEAGYEAWLRDSSRDEEQARRRWAQVEELLGWLERLRDREEAEPDLAALVARLCLLGRLDREEEGGGAVQLATLHAAKGLEFDHVYIVGLEEGLLPHRSALEAPQADGREAGPEGGGRREAGAEAEGEPPGVQEERRLLYVGITRARRSLTLSYARRRGPRAQPREQAPSRFLEELPQEDLRWERPGEEDPAAVR
ncbi:MAG: ATP-dependent DNA helicase Rep, partial [Gammaproteobacteria bacterium]